MTAAHRPRREPPEVSDREVEALTRMLTPRPIVFPSVAPGWLRAICQIVGHRWEIRYGERARVAHCTRCLRYVVQP